MKLVIVEKPSVAQSIARIIGATGRKATAAGTGTLRTRSQNASFVHKGLGLSQQVLSRAEAAKKARG